MENRNRCAGQSLRGVGALAGVLPLAWGALLAACMRSDRA